MLPDPTEIEAERMRRSFYLFAQLAWFLVEPGRPLVSSFHVQAICEHLEAVAKGEITRLIINIPPRHGKSTLACVLFAAWLWTIRPEARMMFASYALPLAERDSVRTRRVIESDWYQQRFGHYVRLTEDQNSKTRFENTRTGARLAMSVGGGATGEGGDVIVVDDALKIEDASSVAARSEANRWFEQTISTRLNNFATAAIVVIGQRLHEDDLPGRLLREGGWKHLCLAAEYDPRHPYRWPGDPRTEPNEPLAPELCGREQLAELKTRLGRYAAAGQLQQLPAPAQGGIVQASWFQTYGPEDLPRRLDLAYEGTPGSDYVVGQLWGAYGADRYLIRQVRRRMTFRESLEAIRELRDWADENLDLLASPAILIEKAATASAIHDVLRSSVPGLKLVVPRGSKRMRLEAVTPQIEAGNVLVPRAHQGGVPVRPVEWAQELIDEVARFPNGAYDDQVDALTQALIELGRPGWRMRSLIAY